MRVRRTCGLISISEMQVSIYFHRTRRGGLQLHKRPWCLGKLVRIHVIPITQRRRRWRLVSGPSAFNRPIGQTALSAKPSAYLAGLIGPCGPWASGLAGVVVPLGREQCTGAEVQYTFGGSLGSLGFPPGLHRRSFDGFSAMLFHSYTQLAGEVSVTPSKLSLAHQMHV